LHALRELEQNRTTGGALNLGALERAAAVTISVLAVFLNVVDAR
jgi:hypothetical protein